MSFYLSEALLLCVQGFVYLVDGLEDLVLDIPNAAQLVAVFISRTIVDDVLPPSFLHQISPGECSGPEVVD
jgi:hypothetical protein